MLFLGKTFWFFALFVAAAIVILAIVCCLIVNKNKENLIESELFQEEKRKILEIVTMLKSSGNDTAFVQISEIICNPFGFPSMPRNIDSTSEREDAIYILAKIEISEFLLDRYNNETDNKLKEEYMKLLCKDVFNRPSGEIVEFINPELLINSLNKGVFQKEYGVTKVFFCIEYILPYQLNGKGREMLVNEVEKSLKSFCC